MTTNTLTAVRKGDPQHMLRQQFVEYQEDFYNTKKICWIPRRFLEYQEPFLPYFVFFTCRFFHCFHHKPIILSTNIDVIPWFRKLSSRRIVSTYSQPLEKCILRSFYRFTSKQNQKYQKNQIFQKKTKIEKRKRRRKSYRWKIHQNEQQNVFGKK